MWKTRRSTALKSFRSARAALALLAGLAVYSACGQTVTNVIDQFNTNSYPNGSITNKWSNWFGGAFQSLSFDATSDANTNPNSGSLKIVANFPTTNTDQFVVWDGYSGISPALSGIIFTNFQCDIRFAAGSATNSSGNYGGVQFGMGTISWGQDYWNSGVTVATGNTNWVHVSIPLNVNTDTNLYNIANVFVHIWGAGLVGPSTLWVDNLQFVGPATNSGTATINYTNTQQRIDGFGASSAWMFSALSTADADLLFSTNTGAGLSLLRTRIAPGGVIDDAEGTIAQEASARGARVWSTPWSPTANFKITNSWIATNDANGLNGGWFSNTLANYQSYASELANYVGLMKNNYGISLYAVSVQNEPTENVNYESCQWTSQEIHAFVTNFSAALTASNFTSTQIMLPEHDGWQWDLATNTMNDTVTSNLVGILACHNYGSSAAPVKQFGTPCPKTLWETEHFLGTDDSITNGLQLAQEIHSFMTVAQVNAYHYWWLTGSGTGSIADNTANPAKRLFVMGNYSRFVRPNFYRIGSTNNSAALVTAYKSTNSFNFVIVAANPTAMAVNQTFTLNNFPVLGTLTPWITSATSSLASQGPVNVTNGTFTYLLPAWTVTSFVYTTPTAPAIAQQPANESGAIGGSATFSVIANGGVPLYYQWLFNGTNVLPGATNASLTLTGLALTNAGNYSVLVTNYLGSVTSTVASLSVVSAIAWGVPATISGAADVATNGTLLYAYNSSGVSATVNNVMFTGVNSDTTWGTNVTLGSGWSSTTTSSYAGGSNPPWSNLPAGYQTVLQGGAWNNGGAATVTLNRLIAGHQYAVQIWVNDSRSGSTTNRTETLTSVGGNTVTLAYNNTYAAGGVGQYSIGTFLATTTNQAFTMNSSASTQLNALQVLDVTPIAPSIVQQPTNQATWVNSNATFAVGAAGTAPLAYQWLFNGTNSIAGATNATLALTGLGVTNAGNYSVIITNLAGSITSAVATLTISTDANFVLKASDTSGSSSFNTIGNWTNSATGTPAAFAPASGYTYRTGPFALLTPAAAGNYAFAGNALTVSAGGSINLKGGGGNSITFGNLSLSGAINNAINPNQIAVLAGNLTVTGAGSLNTQAALNDARGITNNFTMSGSGTLTNLGLGTGPGFVVYNGNNAAFTGPLIVSGNTTLQAASQASLGGNPAGFNAAQLVLDNGTVQPTASFALTNANSGITLTTNGGTFSLGPGITLTVSNPIAGPGNLLCTGGGTLVLTASNTATGNLIVSNSTLAVAGNASFKNYLLGVSNNATLDVTALVVPLAISNRITLAGNLLVSVNSTNTSSRLGASNLALGGTLTISNTGPALAAGNSFALFAASTYSGAFTGISPAAPAAGLAWDTSKLAVNGTLAVGRLPDISVTPPATNFSYGNSAVLTANATGTGPLAYQWYDNYTNAIAWGTNAVLILTNPVVASSGNFTVVATNIVGRATNLAAVIISKATLIVMANNTNRPLGALNPAFTASYAGFVNGDTPLPALSGNPSISTTATSNSPAGGYAIVATNGTLSAANYNFTFVNGVLTITPANFATNITSSVNGASLTLTWPLTHLGWTLQVQSNALGAGLGTNWLDFANSSSTNQIIIPVNPANDAVFYRLRQ